jgi:alpha-glucosidase
MAEQQKASPTLALWDFIQLIGVKAAFQAIRYPRRRRHKDAKFSAASQTQVYDWQQLGQMDSYAVDERGVTFSAGHGRLRVDVLAKDCFRFRVLPGDGPISPVTSYALARTEWDVFPFSVDEDDLAVTIQVDETVCRIERATLKVTVATSAGQIVSEDAAGPAWRGEAVRLSLRMAPHESSHGLGERAFDFDLRGRTYSLWNNDPAGYQRGDDPINLSIPFYVGFRGMHAYGIFWDNPARGTVVVGAPEADDELVFSAEAGEICYYVFAGPTANQVLNRYTDLTGRMPLPPLWALGYHQCRWSYMSAEEIREVAAGFRQRQIPCDAIYFDIDYMDGFRCFTWDKRRFPNPLALMAELKSEGFKSVVMIDPGIKADPGYHVCRTGLDQDVFLKYPDGDAFIAPVWPGDCYFPDFTSPHTRDWWGQLYKPLLDMGVDGVWNDMNEPAIFSAQDAYKHMPDYLIHDYDGQQKTHLEAHNVYGMQMARASREGLEALQPDRRHLLITRSGYAGVQRYASSWTADNISSWDTLKFSISMCLNLGLSGLAFTGPDIGGFIRDATGELFTRWVQAGMLMPFFRGHTVKGSARHEPWAFGQPYEDICRRYIELRYRLLPYIYSTFAECATYGWPIIRPMAMLDGRLSDCVDQFMLGSVLLSAPVVEPGREMRSVQLPDGEWYDYWTGNIYSGDSTYEIAAPLDMLPLFVRAGSVIPHGPVMQYVGQRQSDALELRVYAGVGESTFYEDDGEGKAYLTEAGYRWSRFTCEGAAGRDFTLRWQRIGGYRPSYTDVDLSVIGLPSKPQQIEVDGAQVEGWRFEEGRLQMTVQPFDILRAIL